MLENLGHGWVGVVQAPAGDLLHALLDRQLGARMGIPVNMTLDSYV